MTFWPLTNSDFPTDQTFHQFHDLYTELDLHRIMSGFHGAFATGVASQQGTLTLPDTWFRPPFWDLLMLQLLRPNSSNLPCIYSTFHLEYPLVLSRFCHVIGASSQAGDADSSRAPGLTSALQGSVNVHHGVLLFVPQEQCISSFVYYIFVTLVPFTVWSWYSTVPREGFDSSVIMPFS